MPIEVGLWRLGGKPEPVERGELLTERELEDALAADIGVLDPQLLHIGRQVQTPYGKVIDLLGLDPDGGLAVIELKRERTPRDVVAQALDYGSWIRTLEDGDVARIFDDFQKRYHPEQAHRALDEAFRVRFEGKELPESWNEGHELIIVASELDDSTERIVSYLAEEYDVRMNVVFFRVFQDGGTRYLSRVWLIDPAEVEEKAISKRDEQPWNGEYFTSFGEGQDIRWTDAMKYGYVCAGGGSWYSRTLGLLEPGARVWVNVPSKGYVGVGRVTESAKPITEFQVEDGAGRLVRAHEVLKYAFDASKPAEACIHFVKVQWLKSVPLTEAAWEKGFFANQNSAARPRSKKWAHTVERLKQRWGIKD